LQFDRKLALNEVASAAIADTKADEKPKGGGFGGLIGKMKAAAEDANKQATRTTKGFEDPKQETVATLAGSQQHLDGPVSATSSGRQPVP
jgi:type IV secretory pathway TrbL component